ncbi:MAG: hypothetical protein MJY84_08490 [Bacteroidales bacterium]|nr:hypothetical protein [Bacteroidales bacterium]
MEVWSTGFHGWQNRFPPAVGSLALRLLSGDLDDDLAFAFTEYIDRLVLCKDHPVAERFSGL